VPVIKNTDKITLVKLAIEIHDITSRARTGKLLPGETSGGTFTITNLGQFGNTTGTPIINQPESAILAVGAIKKRAWVVETGGIQTIGIRDIITLALSYDHRIIDGALGGAFLSRIAQLLEQYTPSI
jgi:2-oxoglutarate dehydrogenase E2 component (dihydrolipoamide succinyltransferase)